MQLPSLADLQPYLSLISVAALALLLHLNLSMRQAARDRAEIIEERLRNTAEDLARTEKWREREKTELVQEKQRLEEELEKVLTSSGVTIEALAMGKTLENAQHAIKTTVGELLGRMEMLEAKNSTKGHPEWHLQLAKGYMAQREWAKAASHFDTYCQEDQSNSEAQFSRGVAHANSRAGATSDLAALRAYNEAVTFMSDGMNPDLKARHFTYRGAMLKRMGRTDEAFADLHIALKYARRPMEINDIRYNLAGVYAICGDKNSMIEVIRMLKGCKREIEGIRHHLHTYFSRFSNDAELIELLDGA